MKYIQKEGKNDGIMLDLERYKRNELNEFRLSEMCQFKGKETLIIKLNKKIDKNN